MSGRDKLAKAVRQLLHAARERVRAEGGQFTQARVATDLGINPKTLSDWLSGKATPRDRDNFLALVTRLSNDAGRPIAEREWLELLETARQADEPARDLVPSPAPALATQIEADYAPRVPTPVKHEWLHQALDMLGRAQLVSGIRDPYEWGVHRARSSDSGPVVPYVPRDVDVRLQAALAAAARHGGAVLLTGDSTAGKTRAALEAIRYALPGRWLVAPNVGQDLGEQIRQFAGIGIDPRASAYWFDDVESHMSREGLSRARLLELVRLGAVVVATLRSERYDEFMAGAAVAEKDEYQRNAETDRGNSVIDLMERIRIHRLWSEDEISRARSSADERVREAAAFARTYGVAEYLSAGPALFEDWQNACSAAGGAHRRGAALVAASVDAFRCGAQGWMLREYVEDLHESYLHDVPAASPIESLAEAWEWATSLRHGATALLLSNPRYPAFVRAFEYLPEADARLGRTVPRQVVSRVAATAGIREATAFGVAARALGYPDIAHRLWNWAGNTGGGVAALTNLAIECWEDGDIEGAVRKYREAARFGSTTAMFNLGVHHLNLGEYESADFWWRCAAAKGNRRAVAAIGHQLAWNGQPDEAERWWQEQAEAGFGHAALHRAVAQCEAMQFEKAAYWAHRARADGESAGATVLAGLATAVGDLDAAIAWLRQSDSSPEALSNLAFLCSLTERRREAAQALAELEPKVPKEQFDQVREIIDSGDVPRWSAMQQLLARGMRTDATKYQTANYFVALRCLVEGDRAGAVELLTAIDAPSPQVLIMLAEIATEDGELDLAEKYARTLMESGVPGGGEFLTKIFAQRGQWQEAVTHLRQAVAEGNKASIEALATALLQLGRPGEAESILADGLAKGQVGLASNLGLLRTAQGRPREALQTYLLVADTFHLATNNVAYLLEGMGDLDAAAQWWTRAAELDHEATLHQAWCLARLGRRDEALEALRSIADDDSDAKCALGLALLGAERPGQALMCLRQAAPGQAVPAAPDAWLALGLALAWDGKLDEAVEALTGHLGESDAETIRTWLAAVSGASVTEWFVAAAASGPAWAASVCGFLLEWAGDCTGGERWLQQAAEAGDPSAIAIVASRHKATGDVETAEKLWSVAAAGGDTSAAEQLASMLLWQGRAEEARRWEEQQGQSVPG